MCGRYTLILIQELTKRFGVSVVNLVLTGSYNIAPTQEVPVILDETPKELTMARWGLIPSWSKPETINKYSMINARCETITEKPSFFRLFKKRRCLIIADSFYEWKQTKAGKHPHRILMKDEQPFAFAGLWDRWKSPDGKEITSCTIITTQANKLVADIHDRMPVILPQDKEKAWLDPKLDETQALKWLKPHDPKRMKLYEVDTAVNIPKNNSPYLIVPLS